jgi:two-component system, chemotaxis family, protein-glutamate methylesterase/glutaminase
MAKVKVLIIDDSAVMRKYLSDTLSSSPKIEVVAVAMDPYIAVNKIKKFSPDVLTLDIEMPRMDGLTFLSKLMVSNPMPVIMVSSLTSSGAKETLKALELGALDFICKPSAESHIDKEEFETSIREKVFNAASSRIKRRTAASIKEIEKKHSADAILPKKDPLKLKNSSEKIIALGASTGGTVVIEEILSNIHENSPGIVITQHMPVKFTYEFANRVNRMTPLYVKEAEQGDIIYRGMALVAPGGKHLIVKNRGNEYIVQLNDGPPVNRFKPSVDVMFRSVSQTAGTAATGILCTGMGRDGADGLLEMRQSGARTIAQDEASSAVYGMPKEAVLNGGAELQMNIEGIIGFINKMQH